MRLSEKDSTALQLQISKNPNDNFLLVRDTEDKSIYFIKPSQVAVMVEVSKASGEKELAKQSEDECFGVHFIWEEAPKINPEKKGQYTLFPEDNEAMDLYNYIRTVMEDDCYTLPNRPAIVSCMDDDGELFKANLKSTAAIHFCEESITSKIDRSRYEIKEYRGPLSIYKESGSISLCITASLNHLKDEVIWVHGQHKVINDFDERLDENQKLGTNTPYVSFQKPRLLSFINVRDIRWVNYTIEFAPYKEDPELGSPDLQVWTNHEANPIVFQELSERERKSIVLRLLGKEVMPNELKTAATELFQEGFESFVIRVEVRNDDLSEVIKRITKI